MIPLAKNFYKKAQEYAITVSAEQNPQVAQNYKKLLASIKERRSQKLLIYLAYNKQLPTQMPDEEEALYNKIKVLLNEKEDQIEKARKVKIETEMPELFMPNGGKIGPFKQNQIVELSNESEVAFLLNNKLGEEI